jgi:hypothetical protein
MTHFVVGKPLPPQLRAQLIKHWSCWFWRKTGGWQGPLGAELAHLFASMSFDAPLLLPLTSPIVRLLREHNVARSATIWRFIRVQPTDEN